MKKFLALIFVFAASTVCFAQEDMEKLYWDTFTGDHKEFKDTVGSVKIMKKLDKMYAGYYDEKTVFTPPKEDLDNGYTIFTRSYADDIYPNSRPTKNDLKKSLAFFGTPGEFEPVVLIVLPHVNMTGINMSITDLKNDAGKTIPAGSVDIKQIKYEYAEIGIEWIVKGRYLVKPPAEGFAGVPRPFFLTVKIPVDADPGIYKGEVTVTAGKKPTKLPIALEVFPFKFTPWGEHNIYWMWYYNGYPPNADLEKHMANLRDHGMNCFDSGNPFTPKVSGGSVSVDFSLADRIVPLLKKYGFTSWMFDTTIQYDIYRQVGGSPWSAEHKAALKDFSRQVAEKAKASNWPKLIFTFDEAREDNESNNLRGYIDIKNAFTIMGAAGLITNPSWTGAGIGEGKRKDDPSKLCDYRELCDLPFYNTTHAGYPACEKIIDKVNSLKKPLLLYNCGANRLSFGLLTWQKNALGNSQFWWGAAAYGNPTTGYATSSCAVMTPAGPMDTTNWEQIREGVDDYRYIMTLEKAIADCTKQGAPEIAAAKTLLSKMKGFKVKEGGGTGLEADFMAEAMKNFRGDQLDVFRYEMAKSIMAIQKLK